MNVHLVDGTYELFRHHFGAPAARSADGFEVGAIRGVLSSILSMFSDGATHLAVATDHVVESFRNELWRGYKTGEGIAPELLAQFHPFEDALTAMGVTVMPMAEFEADDGLAAGAAKAAADRRVDRVFICTPDKDLAQSVVGTRVVQFDRRARVIRDADGVREKFGVPPASIPDYLALTGDTADGYPGLPGWGAKSAAAVLARYGSIDQIPDDSGQWAVSVRGAVKLAATLAEYRVQANLFRELATLRLDAPVFASVDAIRWTGPRPEFETVCQRLGSKSLALRASAIAARFTT
ncbi:MAG: flap endonuclease [Acidobacteria bacterium]|jgi:5'-3' exonuclease|nr:flap endonuclease [Acidobacteriota bacterium]